jgi:hypothetical protein
MEVSFFFDSAISSKAVCWKKIYEAMSMRGMVTQ